MLIKGKWMVEAWRNVCDGPKIALRKILPQEVIGMVVSSGALVSNMSRAGP